MSGCRVVVAVDASPPSLAAAEAAAAIAAALGVELVGLFVEDLELLRLAELPAALEADRLSGAVRPMSRVELERQLRAQGERARAGVARAVAEAGRAVRWSFRVARGSVAAEILAAAGDEDLVALGRVGFGGLGGGERLGSTARAVVGGRGETVPFASADDLLERRVRELLERRSAPVLLVR